MPQISAVIPNYNGRQLLAKHLAAVLACLQNNDQLIIVDDASSDDSVSWLCHSYKLQLTTTEKDYQIWSNDVQVSPEKKVEVVVIKNQTNLRFGAAVNRGVKISKGDLILLLNSDVSPHKNILEFLVPHFSNPNTFAVACQEQERNQGRTILGGKNTLAFQRGMFIHARATKFTAGKTAWVSGGSGLFDRAKWLEIGGFDSLYWPAYWEDVDLSWQARQRGWLVLFEPRAVVDHIHESTNKDIFGVRNMQRMSWQNAHKFVWKNGNLNQKIQYVMWRPYWWWKLSQGHRTEGI